jgi:ABC-type polysaccharide/polyol phosphate transport system ATPase subunit
VGKSTLLEVIAGIYQPVSGMLPRKVGSRRRFTPCPAWTAEDSGYENIITAGLLLGKSRREMTKTKQRSRHIKAISFAGDKQTALEAAVAFNASATIDKY